MCYVSNMRNHDFSRRAFLAMAFCDGETLTARLERGAIPAGEAARLALQIARGLARAHQAGEREIDFRQAHARRRQQAGLGKL